MEKIEQDDSHEQIMPYNPEWVSMYEAGNLNQLAQIQYNEGYVPAKTNPNGAADP